MDFEEAIRRGHRTGPLDAGVLRRTWPFDGLPATELESIAADATWARYPYGAEITGPGAECQAVFLIVRGGARVYLHSPQGYQFTGLLLSPADLIDLTGLPPLLALPARVAAGSACNPGRSLPRGRCRCASAPWLSRSARSPPSWPLA